MLRAKVRVVGISYVDSYPDNLYKLAEVMEQETVTSVRTAGSWADIGAPAPEGPAVLLVRNPDNQYDTNAIEVHVPSLGRHGMVGHIPAKDGTAERWARRLDAGAIMTGTVTAVAIHPDHLDNPGLEIEVTLHDDDCPIRGGSPCTCGDD